MPDLPKRRLPLGTDRFHADTEEAFSRLRTDVSNDMVYTPADVADWSGTAPSSLQDALDRIAAALGPIAV
jgi:hypothetical protein